MTNKTFKFPAGEIGLSIDPKLATTLSLRGEAVDVYLRFTGSDSIMELLLAINAYKQLGVTKFNLIVPYLPYSRQDRAVNSGEPFSLQVLADILNTVNFNKIITWDAHSDVAAALFPAGVFTSIEQYVLHNEQIKDLIIKYGNTKMALISPDAGATKKALKQAKQHALPLIEATKRRGINGDILGININHDLLKPYEHLIIVDDICDGGRTFIELGKEIQKTFNGKLHLIVTHGIFSKGKEVFNGIFDTVNCINYMMKDN